MGMTINSVYTQNSQISSIFSKGHYQSSGTSTTSHGKQSSDQVEISQMGRMMSRMTSLMGKADANDMKAKMESFKSAYEDTGISQMDTANMTDEEIQTALSAFASAMGGSNAVQGPSVSDMSSDELKEALGRLQEMGKAVTSAGTTGYGPMQIGGMKPPQGMEGPGRAFQSAYETLGIEELDVSSMSDEDIADILTKFEEAMSDYAPENSKSVSSMTSAERKDALTQIQEMGKDMKAGGRPMSPMGRPPMGAMNGQSGLSSLGASETEDTESTDEKTYIEELLEALEEADTEAEKTSILKTSYKDMYEIINQMNFA